MSNTDHLLYHRVELGVNKEELSDSSIFSRHSEDEVKEEEVCWSTRTKSNRNLRFSIISLSCIVLSALSLGLIVGVGLSNRSRKYAVLRDCTERLSLFSPILEAVEYETVRFDGAFTHKNVYKGDPRPELDAAWDRIEALHKIRLDEGDIYQINKSTNVIKFPPENGGGYVVEIEVFHQLRCLVGSSGSGKLRSKLKTQNMLRKLIYRDYYNTTEHMPRIFEVNPDVLRDHTDQCIDILRQLIMCTGDTTAVTANYVAGHRNPYPDFSTTHVCRNFERLLEWAEENEQMVIDRLPDNVVLAEPPL